MATTIMFSKFRGASSANSAVYDSNYYRQQTSPINLPEQASNYVEPGKVSASPVPEVPRKIYDAFIKSDKKVRQY